MSGFKRLIFSAAFLLGMPLAPQAQMMDMSKFTCGQLMSASQNALDSAIWLSGYYNGLQKNTMLNLDSLKQNAAVVIDECKADPKQTVMQAVNALLARK